MCCRACLAIPVVVCSCPCVVLKIRQTHNCTTGIELFFWPARQQCRHPTSSWTACPRCHHSQVLCLGDASRVSREVSSLTWQAAGEMPAMSAVCSTFWLVLNLETFPTSPTSFQQRLPLCGSSILSAAAVSAPALACSHHRCVLLHLTRHLLDAKTSCFCLQQCWAWWCGWSQGGLEICLMRYVTSSMVRTFRPRYHQRKKQKPFDHLD